ncbi:MAG: helix-turn-helix domain-containing protein [Nanoarchaeota archaeon]
MDAEKLQQLGLNLSEAKVYLILLELGQAQAGEISKKSQINRTTVYDSVERLIERGLVTYVISANKKIFQPVKPAVLVEKIKETEKIATELLPELEELYKTSKEKEESAIYLGRKGIKSILWEVLKQKQYVAFGSGGRFLELMKHDFLMFQKRKIELKIKARIILNESSRKSESVQQAHAKFRFIPNEYSTPTTTFIYGNKIAIIVWSETPVATVISSKEVAKSYKSYFELLWKQSKK